MGGSERKNKLNVIYSFQLPEGGGSKKGSIFFVRSFFGSPPSSENYILHLVSLFLASSFPFLRDPCGSLGISRPWESLTSFGDLCPSLGDPWGSLQISEHLKNKKEKGKELKRTEVLHVNPSMTLIKTIFLHRGSDIK